MKSNKHFTGQWSPINFPLDRYFNDNHTLKKESDDVTKQMQQKYC